VHAGALAFLDVRPGGGIAPSWRDVVRPRIRPTFGKLTIAEAAALLQGLAAASEVDYRAGIPPVTLGLHMGAIRYRRRDKGEHWKTARELWRDGWGDCEDLAAAVAADFRVYQHRPALPILYRAHGRTWHAVVRLTDTGATVDPSRTGGMGRP
jgi:hypothetical protein